MTEHFNKLTPAQAERLAMLAEECGEVIQAVGKILRHGFESRHPNGGETNKDALLRELGDLSCLSTVVLALDLGGTPIPLDHPTLAKAWAVKLRYTHHQEKR